MKAILSLPNRAAEVQHPLIVALIRILAFAQRAQLVGRDVQRRLRFDRQIALVPIAVGEINRVGKENVGSSNGM